MFKNRTKGIDENYSTLLHELVNIDNHFWVTI